MYFLICISPAGWGEGKRGGGMPTPIPLVLRSSHPGARSHDIDSGVIGSPACVLRRRRSDHGEGRRRWPEGPQFRRSRLDVGGPQGQGRPRHQNLSLKAGRRFVRAYRGGCAPAVGCGGRASLFMCGITQPLSGLLAFRVRGNPDIWTLRCRAFAGLSSVGVRLGFAASRRGAMARNCT